MKILLALIIVVSLLLVGCGQSKVINGVERKSIGMISKIAPVNMNNGYSDDVQYEVCWGNVIWGVLLFKTIIAPIYFFGFSMFNPVGDAQ